MTIVPDDQIVKTSGLTRRHFIFGAGGVALAGALTSSKGVGSILSAAPRSRNPQKSSEGPISVLTLGGGIFGLPYLNLKAQFEKDTGIAVNLVQTGVTQMNAQEGAIFAAKSASFDVIQVDPSLLAGYASGGNLLPIEEVVPASFIAGLKADVAPNIIKEWTYKGTLLGLPTEGNCEQGQVNAKYLREFGLKTPQTWDELLSGAQEIVAAKKGVYGFDGNMERTLYAVPTWLPIFWGNGGELWDESYEPQLNGTVALDSLNLLLDLVATMPPGGASYIEAQETKAMAAGLATYNPDGWIPDAFTTSEAPVTAELAGLTMPAGTVRRAPVLAGLGLCISAYSKKKALAGQFVEYFNSEKVQVNDMANAGGQPVRNSGWAKSEKLHPWFPTVYENLQYAIARPGIPQWADIQSAVGTALAQAFSGETTAKKAVEAAQSATVGILKTAGLLK